MLVVSAIVLAAARALLVDACAGAGFTPPRPEQALSAWTRESLEGVLVPPGSPAWSAAHECLVDAFEAAMMGNRAIVNALIARAFSVVRESARRACACTTPGATLRDALARPLCARCLGRLDLGAIPQR